MFFMTDIVDLTMNRWVSGSYTEQTIMTMLVGIAHEQT